MGLSECLKVVENVGNRVVVVVPGVDAVTAVELEVVEVTEVVAYGDEGSHISKNLLHPPGGGDSCSFDGGGWKRRDWINQEFNNVSWILLDPISSLSEEGSQTFSSAVSVVVVLSTELKLLFELKEKEIVSEPVED